MEVFATNHWDSLSLEQFSILDQPLHTIAGWVLIRELNNDKVTRFQILSLSWFEAYANLYWTYNSFK